MLDRARRYARQDSVTIVIEGETGSGKNHLAEHLHAASPRAGAPLYQLSIAAVDDSLVGSELFGHERGAFTGAERRRTGRFGAADGATLLLDEMAKATPVVQNRLLRIIETGEYWPLGADRPRRVDVRLLIATDTPLIDLVEAGAFLPDLYSRLGAFQVRIPPLRDRRADIPDLARHFVIAYGERCGYEAPPGIAPDLMASLAAYAWPFNVRELESTIHRLLVDADGKPLLTGDLWAAMEWERVGRRVGPKTPLSRETIARAVEEHGTVAAAARALGYHRTTLYRHVVKRGQ
jgi:DNA-binding NtrC family response regulator